jgi:hypothetical protein
MFLNKWSAAAKVEAVPPADVLLKWRHKTNGEREIVEVSIATNAGASAGSLYRPPTWCSDDQRWRFHFGYLLRFILTARADFTRTVRAPSWREVKETYRTPVSHWFQRLYGMYSRHSAFGDDWLPISDWIEQLLSALLAWPGMRRSEADAWISDGIDAIRRRVDERIQQLSRMRGAASMTLILPVSLPPPIRPLKDRPMRVCVVQTVIPDPKKRDPRDFPEPGTGGDLTLSDRRIRTRHRNHLSKALAAVRSALDLRETHRPRDGRLDWLILPELSVHPRDVWTHLVPFARMYKAIILAGMTYQRPVAGGPLINSALWVIPTLSRAYGLQVFVLQQGKLHLAPDEEQYNTSGPILQGYRPCQWLVGYPWSANPAEEPLWLTASICYDATDLALAADLRDLSDVYAIPSLNRDVSTFDQMALALHYHMFQYVIVANNGTYGGSNAHVPYREAHERQVFHVHGQPLASIAFLEIDGIGEYLERKMDARRPVDEPRDERRRRWKYPPAGL